MATTRLKFALGLSAWCYAITIFLLALVQAMLGADFIVLGIFATISLALLLPIANKSPLAVADCLYILMVLYHGTLSLVFKTALLQPLDTNLSEPIQSSAYLLVGFISITLGYLASKAIAKSKQSILGLDRQFSHLGFLQIFAKPLFIIGFAFQVLHTIFRPQFIPGSTVQEDGFGGFGSFYFLIPISLCMQTAIYICEPNKKREGYALAAMIAMIATLAIFGNVKKSLVDAILVIVTSFLVFDKAKIRLRPIVIGAALVGLTILYISPIIHIMRPQLYGLKFDQRLVLAWNILSSANFDPSELESQASRILAGFGRTYTPQGSYFFPNTQNLDRFAMILPTDQVVRSLPRTETMGLGVLSSVIETVLPSFLVTKEAASSPDLIAWQFGLRDPGSISRPVIGLVASSIAGYGLMGAAIIPFLVVVVSFSILSRISGPLRNNPWAVGVFSCTTLLAEKEIASFITFLFRDLVINVLFALILGAFFALLTSKSISAVRRPLRAPTRITANAPDSPTQARRIR